MGDVRRYLADETRNTTSQYFSPESGAATAKSNYIALAFVARNTLPDWGVSYSYGTTPVVTGPLSGLTIVGALKDLAFKGLCVFMGDTTINGKKAKPNELKATQIFGSQSEAEPTGEVKEKIDIVVKNYYANLEFFNGLRSGNNGLYDVYLFTDKSVELIRFDADQPVFMDLGHEKTGTFADDIAGGFSITYQRDGEIIPQFGVKRRDLSSDSLRYTFAIPTPAPTGLAPVAGSTERFNLALTTAGKVQRQVVEGGAPIYAIYKNKKDAIPAGEPVAINSNNGEVTFGTTLTTGNYTYTIVAENAVGIFGTWTLIVKVG